MNTIEWLDHTKQKLDLTSDYQLSKALQTSRERISHYRTGSHTMDDRLAVQIAKLLNIPPGKILADIHAERATDERVKRAWQDMARTFAAALLLPLIGGLQILQSTIGILCKIPFFTPTNREH